MGHGPCSVWVCGDLWRSVEKPCDSLTWQAQFRADVAARAVRMVFEASFVMYCTMYCTLFIDISLIFIVYFQCIALSIDKLSMVSPRLWDLGDTMQVDRVHRCQRNLKAAAGELQSRLQGEVMDQALAPLQNISELQFLPIFLNFSQFALPKVPWNSVKFMACECTDVMMDLAHGILMYFGIMSQDILVFWELDTKALKAARCEVRCPTLLEPCLLRPGVVKTNRRMTNAKRSVCKTHCITIISMSLQNYYSTWYLHDFAWFCMYLPHMLLIAVVNAPPQVPLWRTEVSIFWQMHRGTKSISCQAVRGKQSKGCAQRNDIRNCNHILQLPHVPAWYSRHGFVMLCLFSLLNLGHSFSLDVVKFFVLWPFSA